MTCSKTQHRYDILLGSNQFCINIDNCRGKPIHESPRDRVYPLGIEKGSDSTDLTLCPLGFFFIVFFCSCFFSFQNQLFRKIISGIPSECQIVWNQIRPDNMSGLIWVQNVCKGYQQTTLVGNELIDDQCWLVHWSTFLKESKTLMVWNFELYSEACIGGYQVSHIPWSKQANIPYKLANIPIINFPKFSISLEVTKILNQVSHIPGS